MIVIAKIVKYEEHPTFMTFSNEEEAYSYVREAYESIDLLVDIAEVKHYKSRYDEIYKTLFKSFTGNESSLYSSYTTDIPVHVKYVNDELKEERISSFENLGDAETFIEEKSQESNNFSCQVLVNISEVKDYKEKYEEFYEKMFNSYLENKSNEVY